MGRKSLLKSTDKKPVEIEATAARDVDRDVEKKKAILEGVQNLRGSVKGTLDDLGLAQSTYYAWLKRFKSKGMSGLEAGGPVPQEVWKRFLELQERKDQTRVAGESSAKETQTMKSGDDKTRELLFKRFDEAPSKTAAKEGESSKAGSEPSGTATARPEEPPKESMDQTMKYGLIAFACVIGLLVIASFSNTQSFYFEKKDGAVELWRGRFAPMGTVHVTTFPDTRILRGKAPEDSYSKKEAYRMISGYLVERADEILDRGETPNLQAAKDSLVQALKYASSGADRKAIKARLNSISFLGLLSKADLALSRGTISDFEAAKTYLTEAKPYASTDFQKEVLSKRLAAVEYAMAQNKISKGERQLAGLYRDAMTQHLKRAKEYNPEKAEEIDQEIAKIRKWLDEFDQRHVRR